MIIRKYTYKLYPNAKQKEQLLDHLRLHQQLYNGALHERIEAYTKHGISIEYNDQQASLTQIRADFAEYKALACTSERMTLRRLDKAFKSFFRRVKKVKHRAFHVLNL
ncbi:MAG: putative transposase [Parvicella sp.]|jgi:putative transposase